MLELMRAAIISDIHGNLFALEAALEHIQTQNVDQIVVAGDIVNVFPDAKACWDLVGSLNCMVLLGNHERYVFSYGLPDADPAWQTERFKLLKWMHAQFTAADLEAMRSLPMTFQLPGLLVTHASPRSEFESVYETTPLETVEEMFSGVTEPLVIRGHNHVWLETKLKAKKVVTIGALGMPLNGRHDAQYALVTQEAGGWHYEPQYVPYPFEAVLEQVGNDAYRTIAGPIGRIFAHEFATASPHIIAFLTRYLSSVEAGELSLENAVTQYLSA